MVQNRNVILNFGPQHPAAHGVLRLIAELDGERIVSLDPHIGFLHRGTEKLLEFKTFKQGIPYFDRLDYVSMLCQEHGFVLAVEKLLNIKPPIKALYIRVLMDEVTRILNHIMCITTHALDVGALTPFLWGFEEREKFMLFYEQLSGARMHAAYYSFGGVEFDVPLQVLEDILRTSNDFLFYIDAVDDMLSNNPIWITRLKNVGKVSKKTALNYAFTGPVIRGSGIPWDVRSVQPYSVYSELEFKVPTGLLGDSYSRYYVRLLEMRESVNIINQCVNRLFLMHNSKNVNVASLNPSFNPANRIKTSMENIIKQFQEFSTGILVPKGEVSCFLEAPKGETGVVLVSDGTNKPYRCKIKAPGFNHLQGIDFISRNSLLADLVTNIGSLDIVFGEIDR